MRSNIVLRNNPRAKGLKSNNSIGDSDSDDGDDITVQSSTNNKRSNKSSRKTHKLWIFFSLACLCSIGATLFQNFNWITPIIKGQLLNKGKKQSFDGRGGSSNYNDMRSNDGPVISKNVHTKTINNMLNNNKVNIPLMNVNLRKKTTSIISPQVINTNTNNINMNIKPKVVQQQQQQPAKPKSSTTIKATGSIPQKLGTFSCKANETIKQHITYWNDIPMDLTYKSPYVMDDDDEKYITFEKDQAGWNNNRMAFENVILFAVATGRTLVVPPASLFPLMQERGHVYKRQKNFFSFEDIFNLDSIPSLKHISMEEFLVKVATKGHKLKNKQTNQIQYPEKTAYDNEQLEPLHKYLREVAYVLDWRPRKCIGVFPSTPGSDGVTRIEKLFDNIVQKKFARMPQPHQYTDKPTNVDASVVERFREMTAQRDALCVYNETLQNELLIHVKMEVIWKPEIESYRWLAPFYSFFFFENWKADLWAKRFIRDHVRYQDDIMCKAATIVGKIKERARSRNPLSNPNGDYYAFHIRRNDFQGQYAATAANGTTILEISSKYIPVGSTIYIATDEKEGDFFAPFHAVYDVLFLSDFESDLVGDDFINTNFYGQIDQLIASRSFIFLGTFLSTFTAYINRLRGYYSHRDKFPPGYELGKLQNVIHFLPTYATFEMWQYQAVKAPFWFREFPIGWRDIDKGVGTITNWDDEYIVKTMMDAQMLNASAVGNINSG